MKILRNIKSLGTGCQPVLRSQSRSRKEPHLLVGAGAVTRCGSGSDGFGSYNGIKHD
jgi:hypothetical protein